MANEWIISSLDFNCFSRKYTSFSMWAVNVLEPSAGESTTFSNESNTLSLNDLTSAKNAFFNLSKSSIKSSLKLLKFPCRFEFSIALCFLRERHVLFEVKLHFTEPLSIKDSRALSKISLLMFSSVVYLTNMNTSSLPHLLFWRFSVLINAIISTSISWPSIVFGILFYYLIISIFNSNWYK